MVKRKLKVLEAAAKFSKTDDAETTPNEERKEKLVPFDFNEEDCDMIIETKDKEVHIPVNFFKMVSKDVTMPLSNGKITIGICKRLQIKLDIS